VGVGTPSVGWVETAIVVVVVVVVEVLVVEVVAVVAGLTGIVVGSGTDEAIATVSGWAFSEGAASEHDETSTTMPAAMTTRQAVWEGDWSARKRMVPTTLEGNLRREWTRPRAEWRFGSVASMVTEPGSSTGIRLHRRGSLAEVTLDRPAKRNAMTYAMWTGLQAACAEVQADDAIHVVVLRGAADHFCAGADIGELRAERPAGSPTFLEVNASAEAALATLSKPTIAAVEGDCIGGGCALAIDCDFRLATPSARFGITPAKLGIVYPTASLERAVAVIGAAATKRLLMTGELIDAGTAQRIGLVDDVVDDLDDAVNALADILAQRSLLTQAATKQMVTAISRHGSVPDDVARWWAAESARAGDFAEGVAAFTERRRPVFGWRP